MESGEKQIEVGLTMRWKLKARVLGKDERMEKG